MATESFILPSPSRPYRTAESDGTFVKNFRTKVQSTDSIGSIFYSSDIQTDSTALVKTAASTKQAEPPPEKGAEAPDCLLPKMYLRSMVRFTLLRAKGGNSAGS